MSSISRRRNGLMALSVIGGLLSWVRLKAPQSQDRTPASGYSTCCHQLPRERFSRVPSMFDSLGVEVPVQPDGGEGLAKHKGVIARWRLKAVWSKTAA